MLTIYYTGLIETIAAIGVVCATLEQKRVKQFLNNFPGSLRSVINLKGLMIFVVVLIIGTLLGLIGTISFPFENNISFFWVASTIQATAGIFFGWWGVLAGTIFPAISGAMVDGITGQVTLADFSQSFLPFLVMRIAKFSPYEFNKKTIFWFLFGCVLIPNVVGGILGCGILYLYHEIANFGEYLVTLKPWVIGNIIPAAIFGLLLLKTLAPALKESELTINENFVLDKNINRQSIFLKMLLSIMAGSVGPILLICLYELIRTHDAVYGHANPIMIILGIAILSSLSISGIISHNLTLPIKAIVENIKNYRLKRQKPDFGNVVREDEFGYLFFEYEKLINEIGLRETELVEKTRLATIGSMAAMIVHDVRKPLTAIQMFLQALPEIKNDSKMTENLASDIEKSVVHTSTMLNDILEFSHEEPKLDLQNHSIQALVLKALNEVFHINFNIKINFSYDFYHGNKSVYVDDLRIIRVLVNVITNSLEAMVASGGNNQVQGNMLFKTELLEKDNQHFIKLLIVDDGQGILSEVMQKIYNPFFSYGKKNGNGLGLSICKNIMIAHGGDIIIKNRENSTGVEVSLLFMEGTAVDEENDLKLVLNSQVLALENIKPKNCYSAQEEKGGLKTYLTDDQSNDVLSVLIVDDEEVVRSLLHNLIASLFKERNLYEVKEAASAEEALVWLKSRNFSHVITDVDFGRNCMSGYDFAKQILDQYKNLYVIVHSNKRSFHIDEEIKKLYGEKFLGSVQKPITGEDLLKLLSSHILQDLQNLSKGATVLENPRHKKILLLNDDTTIAFSMKKILSHYDIDICLATNVRDAFNSFLENSFDFILSDINLGNNQEDGYVFLEKVRSVNKSIPFIMMSGYNKKNEQEKACTLGATAYIQTPFKIEELVKLISI